MNILIKKSGLFIFLFALCSNVMSQTRQQEEVTQVVEKFRKAIVDADKTTLENMVSDKLSYGHSAGFVENKKLFIDNLVTGKSDFVSMDLTQQTIDISDNIAVVRNKLDAVTNDEGKPGEAHLFVLMVWQKLNGQWKLLARQGVKQPVKS